jgi:hypothetical protein
MMTEVLQANAVALNRTAREGYLHKMRLPIEGVLCCDRPLGIAFNRQNGHAPHVVTCTNCGAVFARGKARTNVGGSTVGGDDLFVVIPPAENIRTGQRTQPFAPAPTVVVSTDAILFLLRVREGKPAPIYTLVSDKGVDIFDWAHNMINLTNLCSNQRWGSLVAAGMVNPDHTFDMLAFCGWFMHSHPEGETRREGEQVVRTHYVRSPTTTYCARIGTPSSPLNHPPALM